MIGNGFEIRSNHRPSIFLKKDPIFLHRDTHLIIKQNSVPETVVFPYLAICKKRAVERQ